MSDDRCKKLVESETQALVERLSSESDQFDNMFPVGVLVIVAWVDGSGNGVMKLHAGLTDSEQRARAMNLLEKAALQSVSTARMDNST